MLYNGTYSHTSNTVDQGIFDRQFNINCHENELPPVVLKN